MCCIVNKILTFFVAIFPVIVNAVETHHPWIQGGLIIGKTSPSNRIEFMERSVRVNDEGKFVIGLGRDAKSTVILKEIFPNGKVNTLSFKVKQRHYNEQRINGLPQKTVHVPEEALARIHKEIKLTKVARQVNSVRQDFLQPFIWPAKGIITGVYGSRRVYNGVPKRPHYGIDIAAAQGSPVLAPASGVITLVHENMYFSGGTIILDHGHGISSTFIHLHKAHVNEGDVVEQGQRIAEIGSTGRSTGPHLDWRINWFKQRLDPQLLMGNTIPDRE
jgi:murein DD-endopeptidase MepM/ murein hydrolase activator NlpD